MFHRADPFAAAPGPFFSRYRGTLQIDKAGKHKFYTSSTEQARARYESLVAQYPGSPLVESSREKLASLTDGESLQTKKTKKK